MIVNSRHEVEDFLNSLDVVTGAKAARIVGLLESYGNRIRMPYSRPVFSGLFELRIRGTIEVRILYQYFEGEAYLLHAFVKKSERTPWSAIRIAMDRGLD